MSSQDHQDVLEIGQLFAGRYAIEGALGKGGFSRVYAARQLNLGRPVALKIFAPRDLQNKEARQRLAKRFMKEAQLLARLNDPHTITLHDYGITADGELFQVFELVQGVTFKQLVRGQGPLHPERLTPILEQILWSLSEAHAFGMIHRDIKPSNIMVYDHLERHDRVKVLDFGVAKLVQDYDTAQSDMTADGMILGTPRYMSPEQIIGEPLTPASDIYSLGIVMYEALCMELPYDKDLNLLRRRQQQITRPAPLPEWLEKGPLRSFLTIALQGNPAHRFDDAAQALHAITHTEAVEEETLPYISNQEIVLGTADVAHDSTETPHTNTLTAHRSIAAPQRRSRLLMPLMLLVILALVVVIIAMVLREPSPREREPDEVTDPTTIATPTPHPDDTLKRDTRAEPEEEPAQDTSHLTDTSKPEPREKTPAPPPQKPPRVEPDPDPPPKRDDDPIDLLPTKKSTSSSKKLTPKTKKTEKKEPEVIDLLPDKKPEKKPSGFVIKPLDEK